MVGFGNSHIFLLLFLNPYVAKSFQIKQKHFSSTIRPIIKITTIRRWTATSPNDQSNPGNVLGGVSDFESWWKEKTKQLLPPSTIINPSRSSSSSSATKDLPTKGFTFFKDILRSDVPPTQVRHASFLSDSLRGLEFVPSEEKNKNDSSSKRRIENVVVLPAELVLRAPYDLDRDKRGSDNWDTLLSLELLKECSLGRESDLFGYCSLLTSGLPFTTTAPPSTAPNALRNWTPQQRSLLSTAPSGQRLLQTLEKQNRVWDYKYSTLDPSTKEKYSKRQFFWAMEVVHSRAFKGDFGFGSPLQRVASGIAVPSLVAAFGLKAILGGDPSDTSSDWVSYATAFLVFSPLLLQMVDESLREDGRGKKGGMKQARDAVLLPFIDSANHVEGVESAIEFDPVGGEFSVSLGEGCLEREEGGEKRVQAFISYGVKSDGELLLNYGFLPGANGEPTLDTGKDQDDQRRILAEEFIKRNPE